MFSHSIRLGRILGIEIDLDYTWFIILALVAFTFAGNLARTLKGLPAGYYWLLGLLIAVLLFVCVILHELSHSIIAKRHGLGIAGITLFLFGGVSKLVREPRSAWSELQVAIIGPLVSLVLAGIFFLLQLLPVGPVFKVVFSIVAIINLSLAIFNLLPGLPLDGGRVLRAIVWAASGNFSQATRVAALSGQALGFLLILGGVMTFFTNPRGVMSGLWLAFIGWFLIQAAQSSYQQTVLRRLLSGVRVSSLMTSEVTTVPAATLLDEIVSGYFLTHNYAAFPVLRDGEVVGLIHLSDVRQIPRERWATTPVGEVVSSLRPEQVVSPDEDAWEALTKMASENQGRLLVMQRNALCGILSRTDVMRLIRTKMELGA